MWIKTETLIIRMTTYQIRNSPLKENVFSDKSIPVPANTRYWSQFGGLIPSRCITTKYDHNNGFVWEIYETKETYLQMYES